MRDLSNLKSDLLELIFIINLQEGDTMEVILKNDLLQILDKYNIIRKNVWNKL